MRKKAQGLVEYGLMLAFVAVIAVVMVQSLGNSIEDANDDVDTIVGNNANQSDQEWCTQAVGGQWNGDGTCTPPP